MTSFIPVECDFLRRENCPHLTPQWKTFNFIKTISSISAGGRLSGGRGMLHLAVTSPWLLCSSQGKLRVYDRAIQIMCLLSLQAERCCYRLSHPPTRTADGLRAPFIGILIKTVLTGNNVLIGNICETVVWSEGKKDYWLEELICGELMNKCLW